MRFWYRSNLLWSIMEGLLTTLFLVVIVAGIVFLGWALS
jgi:hypothetical protein